MVRTQASHPELAVEIVDRFKAINWPHLPALQLGLKKFESYDLDFALAKLIEAERHYTASQGGPVKIDKDPALRNREGYFHWMAESVKIHYNWPQHLLKSFEMDAWTAHYEYAVNECNAAGYYLKEVLSTYNLGKCPVYLTDKYNVHSDFFSLMDVAMLCKMRWYRVTQSRYHKPDRLATYEDDFERQVLNWKPDSPTLINYSTHGATHQIA